MPKKIVAVKVNGKLIEKAVEPRTLLIHFLREDCNLTGAHIGCDTSHCGACARWTSTANRSRAAPTSRCSARAPRF